MHAGVGRRALVDHLAAADDRAGMAASAAASRSSNTGELGQAGTVSSVSSMTSLRVQCGTGTVIHLAGVNAAIQDRDRTAVTGPLAGSTVA